jgi:uncharacterized membrane protein
MLKFVAKMFESFLGVILWINLVGCAITGIIGGWAFGDDNWDSGAGGAFLGLLLGAIVGILTNIVFGGLIVIFVNMSKELSEVKKYVKKISSGYTVNNNAGTATAVSAPVAANSSTGDDTSFEVYSGACKSCGKQVDSSSNQVRIYKVCNHCGTRL